MPCDGRNSNCDRRKELLTQLKCIVSAMDRKKPCEWDEPLCPPPLKCPGDPPPQDTSSRCMPIKDTKSVLLRGSVIHRCECIKRNGLQDRCMMWDCMGRPECMTKLYPICQSGRAALLRLTDIGDVKVAMDKLLAADKVRESALAAYCRLVCPETNNNGTDCPPPLFITPPPSSTPKGPRIQPVQQRMLNDQSHRLQQPPLCQIPRNQPCYPPRQEYQQPMEYCQRQGQQQHFYPQHSGYPTSFVNHQQVYPLNQEYQHQNLMNQQQFQF